METCEYAVLLMQTVGATHDKKHGGQVGVLKTESGVPANLNNPDLMTAWNNDYMKNVPSNVPTEKCPASCNPSVIKKKRQVYSSKRPWETDYWLNRYPIEDIIGETAEDGSVLQDQIFRFTYGILKCNLKCIMCSIP